MKFQIVIIIFLVLFCFSKSESQFLNKSSSQVLVKGKVTDEFTGKPMGIDIVFENDKGTKIKIKSNSDNGTYEQLLEAGETYGIILSNYDIIRQKEKIIVDTTKNFKEQSRNFVVKQLTVGRTVLSLDGFEPNTFDLNQGCKDKLDEIETLLKFNRSVKLEFRITSHDSYSKPPQIIETPTKAKKGKKAQKNVPPKQIQAEPDPTLIKSLVDSRIAAISKFIDGWKLLKQRIEIIPDYTLANPPVESGNISLNPDFLITVKEMKNAFE
jgi:hypothetical protein